MKIRYTRPSIPWSSIPTFQKATLTVTWTATAVWLASMAYAGWMEVLDSRAALKRLQERQQASLED